MHERRSATAAPPNEIALKFTRELAFGFTLCIVKNHKI